ncbi:MAG: hypothetical protein U0L12_02745 [Ruminococcus sp.]|nr:hypothetical protein [Ruminococcus sp.]
MKIYIRIKSAGRRRPVLDNVPYEIPDNVQTVRELITEIVKMEVKKYNDKGTDVQIIPFLTQEELEEQAQVGKVGFGRIYSEKKADERKAIENALQCFGDGIVRIFQNEEELAGLETKIQIKEQDVFTFMKFVFLAGRMW